MPAKQKSELPKERVPARESVANPLSPQRSYHPPIEQKDIPAKEDSK